MRPIVRPGFSRLAVAGVAGRPLRWAHGPPCWLSSLAGQGGWRSFVSQPAQPETEQRKSWLPSRKALVGAAAVGSLLYLCYLLLADDSASSRTARGLNRETFVPFTVVAREPVSPTAVVLTLRLAPDTPAAARAATRAALVAVRRRRGTWAVEAKQPQLQIAREYTPLPADPDADEDDCTVRLFVRVVPGGEMSRYLVQRAVGETVSLRGPRTGFDVAQRLGSGGRVVFLAAGTGIAPALQAAEAVLGGSSSSQNTLVTILWANRRRQDSDGLDRVDMLPQTVTNPIVHSLQAMRQRYGRDRLQVRCFVDEDQTFITEAVVRASLDMDRAGGGQASWWRPWKQQQEPPAPAQTRSSDVGRQDCLYHSAAMLERLEADHDEDGQAACSCVPSTAAAGRNLVMVSGPDGFVSYWTGPKRWAGGQERQGPVGGVLGRLKKQHAESLTDWLVLKL